MLKNTTYTLSKFVTCRHLALLIKALSALSIIIVKLDRWLADCALCWPAATKRLSSGWPRRHSLGELACWFTKQLLTLIL